MRTIPFILTTLLAASVQAQEPSTVTTTSTTGPAKPNRAAEIATQPIKDVDARRIKVPPPLVQAVKNPYSTAGAKSCKAIAAQVAELTSALGPDFGSGNEIRENKAGKLAEAGGKTIVNSIIPFRGLVREITGAAPAQRRLSAAIDAGYARRGFLRGLQRARGCRATA